MNIIPSIFIIDDNQAVGQSLRWLLAPLKANVFLYDKPKEFIEEFRVDLYGCLLIDILMPEMNGFDLMLQLQKCGNRMPIIMLTGHGNVDMAVKAMKMGAKDFITKPFKPDFLLQKIKLLLSDYKNQYQQQINYLKRCSTLTDREMEVMTLIIKGKLNKQIADELSISPKTVELHRSNIMQKLDVHTAAELINLYYKSSQI